ncbi:MAG: ornithine cyclodeaminase [Prevotella sp.]|nr:ornithine cyclodeaminase [Prevotella sp.]
MVNNPIRIISTEQIRQAAVTPATCIEWVEESFRMKYDAQLPAKVSVHPQSEDFFTSMPALLPERFGRFGIKIVSRIDSDVPALKSDIMLYDSHNGHLLAIFDGGWITAMRTGAVAALAVRTLKRSDADTYSIMGLGNTARATALCLLADHPEKPVRFRLLRYKDQAELFIERFSDYANASFEIIDSIDEFIGGAQVVISCVTAAFGKIFCPDDSLFQEGVLVVPVHTRGFQNCDLFFDKVYGDDTGHVCDFKYFKQFRQFDEFSRVLLGDNPGRENDRERILSYNIGLGLHDVLFASKLYDMMDDDRVGVFTRQTEDQKYWV